MSNDSFEPREVRGVGWVLKREEIKHQMSFTRQYSLRGGKCADLLEEIITWCENIDSNENYIIMVNCSAILAGGSFPGRRRRDTIEYRADEYLIRFYETTAVHFELRFM